MRSMLNTVAIPLALLALLAGLSGCGGGGTTEPAAPTAVERVVHHWRIAEHRADQSTVDLIPLSSSVDESVDAFRDLGELIIRPPGDDLHAMPEAYATALGDVFWVAAQAPVGDLTKGSSAIGSYAYLDQVQTYRKTTDTGSLDLVISLATLEAIDSNPHWDNALSCPELATKWYFTQAEWDALWKDLKCDINAKLYYQVSAWKDVPITDASGKVTGYGMVELASGATFAHLYGAINGWEHASGPSGDSNLHYKVSPDFVFDPNVDATADAQHAILMLNQPAVISIPLDAVARDETFKVMVVVSADVNNRRQLESFVGARLRDPAHLNGVSFNAQGVELIPLPPGSPTAPPPPAELPAPACSGPANPAAGTLQFESAKVYAPEGSGLGDLLVWVTRSGGSAGEVSAMFSTQDGSAHAGADYQTVNTLVRFNDGEQGKRFVAIPIVNNTLADGLRTATLSLSNPRGCASLGTQRQTLLTIVDDDQPPLPPPASYTLGGSVSGLAGSGLVLRDVLGGGTLTPVADGSFVLATPLPNGSAYDLRVDVQPNNPAQNCVVANGSGSIAGANVSNVTITCSTVAANGALDASFSSGGKLSNAYPAAKAIALQADGKLLAVGGMTLSRYGADGTPDTSFGSGGKVSIVANGGGADAMQAVAVQPDGRIVVAGYSSRPTPFNDDFAVLRYNADGSPDTGFGSGGLVLLDFAGLTDRVHALLLQPDGKIVAVGFATLGTLVTADQDVALVRLNASGALDTSFGSGGKLTANVAGKADFGYAAALQADGKIVVAGRVGVDGGSDPDFGLLRVNADGSLDAGFGSLGSVRTDFGLGNWEEAAGVAVQPDGRILVAGRVRVGGVFNLALARFASNGAPDSGFGNAGLVTTAVSTQADVAKALALQADGKIVVVGQMASLGSNPDMVVARYQSDGALDSGFGSGGTLAVDFYGAIDSAEAVAVQPDGRLVLGGAARNAGTTGLGLVRLMP